MPRKRKAAISKAAVARAAVARKARMDKINSLKKHKDHNEKETSDEENTNNSKDDVDNNAFSSCLDGDNSKTSDILSDIADDSQHSNYLSSSECSNNTKIIKIVEIIDDEENVDDENDNCFTTSLDSKNNFINCKKKLNNLNFIENNIESQSSENSMYELAELSSVHSNNDEESDLNNEKLIDNDDEDDGETTEYEVIVLEDDSENNNSQNCVEMEICVNDDDTPIIKSIVTVDPNDHQSISIINKNDTTNTMMTTTENENKNDVEMVEEEEDEEVKIINIVEIKENDDFINNESVSTLQTSIKDLNITEREENIIKPIIENDEHNNKNSEINIVNNNKNDDGNNSLTDNNDKINLEVLQQSLDKNEQYSKNTNVVNDENKSFINNNEIVEKLITHKENEIKNGEEVSLVAASLMPQTNGIIIDKSCINKILNKEPIIILSNIIKENNSSKIHNNNHHIVKVDDNCNIKNSKENNEINLKLKKQHQNHHSNDLVNTNNKSDVIQINHANNNNSSSNSNNNNNLIINKCIQDKDTESTAAISPLLNGKNNNDDDDDTPGIRRSSRIKIISESKQKSRGHGLVKDRERFLKKVNNSCDLQIPNNLDNSLLLLEAIPSTVQSTNLDKLQPVKVKSRWRRSSELEMRESIATKSLLLNGHQSNSNSSSCSSLNGIVKSQCEIEKELQHQKDIEKRLSHFVTIKENCYHCDRNVSKEAKKMTCDCFLTKEEIGRGELGCGEDCLNRLLMIECSSRCIVGERCTNRRFQKNQYAQCNVFRTEKKGFGILANVEIHAGEFIMEYVGEVLNSKQFDRRANEYSKDKNKHYYFMALRSDAVIDATLKGNISRFINHSCDPNAETQKWTVNGELRIGFFSTRTIIPGEEITFDYQYQRYGKEAQKCYCEAACCRGWIGEEPDSYDEEESDDEKKDNEATKDKARTTVAKTSNDVDKNESDITESVTKVIKKKVKKKRPKMKRQEITDEPDLDEEITKLVKSGLKNQAHTLKFSRLIVRARLMDTRSRLLNILQNGDFPCRRLFLDYHGLRLLHGWMCDATIVESKEFYIFRLELLETLETLPIPNKTMLKDSKVIYSVEKWSTICSNEFNNKSFTISNSSANDSRTDTPPVNNGQTDETNISNDDEKKEKSKELLKNIPEILRQSNAIMEEIGLDKLKQIINNTGKLQQEKEKLQQEQKQIELLKTTSDENQQLKIKIYLLAIKLLKAWKNLPEVFRIPKKERIEQMKEHEREADQQCIVSSDHVEEVKRSRYKDRYRDRERDQNKDKDRDAKDSRDKRLTGDQKDSWNSNINYNKSYEHYKKNLSKEQRRQLFEMKVAKEEAAKLKQEQWRLHEIKCLALRLDPHKITPENVPTVVNPATGQWYTYDRRPVATPPSHAHIKIPPKQMSTNPVDYNLPKLDLPPFWKYAIDPKGRIYYYHVKIRIPQWDLPIKIPPLIEEKVVEPEPEIIVDSDSSNHTDSSTTDTYDTSEEELERTLLKLKKRKKKRKIKQKIVKPKERQIDCENNEASKLLKNKLKNKLKCKKVLTSKSQEDSGTSDAGASVDATVKKHKKKKVRKEGLVTERIISPRREEDRLYNQREMKKYKATKEKLRKRKEEAKLKRKLPVMVPPVNETTPSNNSSTCSSNSCTPKKLIKLTDGLPIVKDDDEYLAELDIEKKIIHMNEKKITKLPPPIATVLPTPSVIKDEGTFRLPISRVVEDTEAMKKAKLLKKQQIMYEEWKRYQARMKHKMIDVRSDSRKHSSKSPLRQTIMKGGKRIDIKGLNPLNFYNESRRIKDRFRNTIAAVVVQKLNPYRKSDCLQGRITSNEDFKHLARKLTHFVMLKELKHCDNTVFALEVTESVKAKAREFIKKYMAKYGAIYIRADNEPDFRDFYLRI